MHRTLQAFTAGCLLLLTSCSGGPSPGAASIDEFERRFLEATRTRNFDELMSLYCWDGVDEEMKTWVVDSMVRKLVYLEAVSARYVPSASDARPTILIKGKEYRSSLPVTGYLEVELKGELSATMPVGVKDQRYYIAVMAARRE